MKTNQLILTKESSITAIKSYFVLVSELHDNHGTEFCIDFDTVWPLAYSSKQKATDSLKGVSTEGIDYQIFNQKVENPNSHNNGGRPTDKYMLTVPTLEWFIARRVPAVFEVYRQVFHAVRKQAAALPFVNQELVEKVGYPVLVDGRLYWPYRRVLRAAGYRSIGTRFYQKAAAHCTSVGLFDAEKQNEYLFINGSWHCSEKVFKTQRRRKMAWDRYQSEKQPALC